MQDCIDLGYACAVALAEQVDTLIAQRQPGRLHIIDHFRNGVSGQVHPSGLQAGGASRHGCAHGIQRSRAEKIAASARHCFGELGAVQFRSPVHAAVTDQHYVVICQQPGRGLEIHIRTARTAAQIEDRFDRVDRGRTNAFDRQGDQAAGRVRPVLGHHQRAAVSHVFHSTEFDRAWGQEDIPGAPAPERLQPVFLTGTGTSSKASGAVRPGVKGG